MVCRPHDKLHGDWRLRGEHYERIAAPARLPPLTRDGVPDTGPLRAGARAPHIADTVRYDTFTRFKQARTSNPGLPSGDARTWLKRQAVRGAGVFCCQLAGRPFCESGVKCTAP